MINSDSKPIIAALDIGTSKVAVMIAEILPDGQYQVIGLGEETSKGVKKGLIINIDDTVKTIQKAFVHAEQMAKRKIQNLFVSIGGRHISDCVSRGLAPIKNNEVTAYDIERVMETARAINIPVDQQLLHTFAQEYMIDSQKNIREPLGLSGVRLEVQAYNITGAKTVIQNLAKCVRRSGFEITQLILQPLASAEAVLDKDEKEIGVALIDIGAGTTDVAVFHEGVVQYVDIIPAGGDLITNDIAADLGVTLADAESLKLQYGAALEVIVDPSLIIQVTGLGSLEERSISQQTLAGLIEPRMANLFDYIQRVLHEKGYGQLYRSIVLTGGGALLPGIDKLSESVFSQRTRVAKPRYTGQLNELVAHERFSASHGLLIEAKKSILNGQSGYKHSVKELFKGIKSWFIGNF